jgi:hypothetical protein
MATIMSFAMAKAGLISEENALQATGIPWHLRAFQKEIAEMETLTNHLTEAGAKADGMTKIMMLFFQARMSNGNYSEAYAGILKYLRAKVAELEQ